MRPEEQERLGPVARAQGRRPMAAGAGERRSSQHRASAAARRPLQPAVCPNCSSSQVRTHSKKVVVPGALSGPHEGPLSPQGFWC